MSEKRDLTEYFNEIKSYKHRFDVIREAIDSGKADKCDFDSSEFYFNVVTPLANEIKYPMMYGTRRLDPFIDVDDLASKLKLIKEYTLHNRIAYLKTKAAEEPKKAKIYNYQIKRCETELKIKYNWIKPKDETL